jgi:hypothetical protein
VAGFLTITSQLATTPTVTTNTVVTMTPMILIDGWKCHGTRILPYAVVAQVTAIDPADPMIGPARSRRTPYSISAS